MTCITVDDNSAQAMDVSDFFMITRPDRKTCPMKWPTAAGRLLQGAEYLDMSGVDYEAQSAQTPKNGLILGFVLLSVGAVMLILVKMCTAPKH